MSAPREQGDIPASYLPSDYAAVLGDRAVSYFYFSGNVADEEYVKVGGRVYQFTDDGTVTNVNYVPVDVSAALTPAVAAPALVSAINGDEHASHSAKLLSGDVVAVISNDHQKEPLVEATTNVARSAAAMVLGYEETEKNLLADEYIVTAQDVTTWAASGEVIIGAGVFAAGAPKLGGLVLRNSSDQLITFTTANLAVAIEQVSGYLYQLVALDAAADLSAGDKISWSLLG
jgi:hypothetical protein